MKYLLMLCSLFSLACKSQSSSANIIDLLVRVDSVVRAESLSLSISVKNDTDLNLLLYGFNSNLLQTPVYPELLCGDQLHVSAGIAMLIFNQKGEREYAIGTIPDSIDYKPMPKERFEFLMAESKGRYLTGTIVVNSRCEFNSDKEIDLRSYHLKKGIYELLVIYYSGKSRKMVIQSQLDADRKKFSAEAFQGCAYSNRVTFSIN